MAILQVNECAHTLQEFVRSLTIYIIVGLLCVVAIVLIVRLAYNLSEVVAIIFVPSTTEGSWELIGRIVQRSDSAIEVVAHLLLLNHVAFLVRVCRESPIDERLVALILLVVAIATSVMACDVEVEGAIQALVPYELIVLLMIVVGLIVEEYHVAIIIFAHISTRVVWTTIHRLFILWSIVPSMVGLLLVVPGDELYYGIIAEISSLQEIRV